ncbi:hypothetical protein BABINDRAFT_162546 [Babjeviella inositovora NRRL Y-12698]|uniref:Uncharacterized protein n=1 Tax=Babjeviella inositovora NRRL Y-12698 TaxID=984486 RepID=A0A1E3QME6_9ASCO|nr:uncharacterized protein BABINDRAFT_162546 [Babjeviella inositovora NRRL Y-12698]ODQ78876.1 hypothetical protein BABINDRAFT_162546 [Babjeviella inositovora NRRL Y-12698]
MDEPILPLARLNISLCCKLKGFHCELPPDCGYLQKERKGGVSQTYTIQSITEAESS